MFKILRLLIPITAVFISTVLGAQENNTFDTAYVLNNKKYITQYDYFFNGKDTTYNGKLYIHQEYKNQEDIYEYFTVNGNFNNNKAEKSWKLKKGVFEPIGLGYYKDYSFSYEVNGNEFMAEGEFVSAEKIGVWRLYDWQIRDSKITDTTLTAKISFIDNKAKGNFEIQIEDNVLEGLLGDDELTEGNWTLYRQNTKGGRKLINEWIFEDNVLKSIRLNRNDTVYEVQIAEAGLLDSEEVILPLNENFLNIIELKAKIYNEALIEQYQSENSISNLYFNLISKLDLLDQNLSPIVKTSIKPEIRSKIMALPLNKTEEELFTEISELLDSNKLKTQSILNNPQINISSISNKNVEELKYVLERINQLFLIPTKEIISLKEQNQIRFFNRDKLINYKLKVDSVRVILQNDTSLKRFTFQSDLGFLSDNSQSYLERVSQLMKITNDEIEHIDEILKKQLSKIQKEEKLVKLEESLLAQYENVKKLADSLITGEHDNFAGIDVADAIVKFADNELSDYNSLPSAEEKLKAINPLINCLNKTESLINTIHKSPETIYKINEAYTKVVFNPYTFTNMEEKSKPSIYRAFNKLLLPGIFQNMQKLTCDNMELFEDNFKVIYDEMLSLLKDDDTNRMERKVKRAKTADKAAEILNIELSF